AKVRKEFQEAQRKANAEATKIFVELMKEQPDTLAAAEAATILIGIAARPAATDETPDPSEAASPDQVRQWAALAVKAAAGYGPRFTRETAARIASQLGGKKEYAAIGLGYAQQCEKMLTNRDSE